MPRVRNSNPCDGCTLRRVKCEAGRPCYECNVRGIECTVLRKRQKRGPKGGPRTKTRQKVEEFQRSIRSAQNGGPVDGQAEGQGSSSELSVAHEDSPDVNTSNGNGLGWDESSASPKDTETALGPATLSYWPQLAAIHSDRLPLDEYRRFIDTFRNRAYAVWPVIGCDDLLGKLAADSNDHEAYALAASLCAATIAQLRLSEHTDHRQTTSSCQFARDCLKTRELYDYRETYSLSSVLIPFFLHVYYANDNKLRTAGFYLRESITYVHALELGRPETYAHLDKKERSLRLRLYWLLLVTER